MTCTLQLSRNLADRAILDYRGFALGLFETAFLLKKDTENGPKQLEQIENEMARLTSSDFTPYRESAREYYHYQFDAFKAKEIVGRLRQTDIPSDEELKDFFESIPRYNTNY